MHEKSDSDHMQALKKRVQNSIIDWYSENGRNFFWRSISDPYHILIAEMLLRRTTATAVSRIFPVVIGKYDRPEKLAKAKIETLATIIQPLGLQRTRAQHLKQMALTIVKEHAGVVPEDLNQLIALPGVGLYVASAVLNFAFGKRYPLVDSNVIHLMSRVFGLTFRSPTDKEALMFMGSFNLRDKNKFFYWGIIDLVAMNCLRKRPRCNSCPLSDFCTWKAKAPLQLV